MQEIREIYNDYVIVTKDVRSDTYRIEMDVIVTPYIDSLYSWLRKNGVVKTQLELLKMGYAPKKEDEDVIFYLMQFVHKYHYTYTESTHIYLNFSCGGRHGLAEERIINKIRKKIDKLPILKRELSLFLRENLSSTIIPKEPF